MQQPLPFSFDASLDIQWDWSAWLGTASIVGAVVTPPAGVAVSNQAQSNGKVQVWVTLTRKLADGTLLPVMCHIVTNDTPPRADTRTITLQVATRSS
jgi:hypothetical protein